MTRRMAAIATLLALMTVLLIQPASGFIARNTFQPEATLSLRGRAVLVTAQIACTEGERLSVEVTVAQQSTLAHGKGFAQSVCSSVDLNDPDAFQEVQVWVLARGRNRFDTGQADASGFALTRAKGDVTDVRLWRPEAGIMIQ